jgi:hypothetical protein
MIAFEHVNRRGGLVELHPATIRLEDGDLIAVEVWHWRWFSIWCNWRNRRRYGWTIVRKRPDGWRRQRVLMVQVAPVPHRRRVRDAAA